MDANSTSTLRRERPELTAPETSSALFTLTRWENTWFNYWKSHVSSNGQWVLSWYTNVETRELKERMPAYDIGYLLSKTPKSITIDNHEYFLTIGIGDEDKYEAYYMDENDRVAHIATAESIVETVAALLLDLIENSIIPGKVEPLI